MPGAGQLDRKITIERRTAGAPNAFNESAKVWAVHTAVRAKREDVSDAERVAAGQVGTVLMARFVVRSSTKTRSVTSLDRINGEGGIWNITGVKEAKGPRKRWLEITAVRSSDTIAP